MASDSFKIKKSLNIEPIAGAAPTAEGDIAYNLSTNKASLHNGTSASPLVTEAHSAALTNKTINGSSNTITNVSLTAGVTGTLPVANGGTNVTSWTANHIAYATSTTALAGDSTFTWDDVNKLLKVGTGTSNGRFSVVNTSGSYGGFYISSTGAYCSNFLSQNSFITQALQHHSATAAEGVILALNRNRGTIASPGVVLSGDILASINANGLPSGGSLGTATTTGQASIKFYAMENLTTTAQATEIRFSTTPTGTATPKERLRIKQDGSLELAGATSGYVALIPPAAPTSYTLTLPSAQGAADTVLTNDGAGTLTWATGGSGSGGINYITATNGNAIGAWTTFDDVSAIVDGTGGSPSVTYAVSTNSDLRGTTNFLFTHGASDQQYEGFSYAFSIDPSDKGKVLQCSFDYLIASGTFADDGLHFYIYDVTNAALIQPAPYKLKNSGIVEKFAFEFQTASNSTSYRLLAAVSTSTATAYTIRFDNWSLGPQAKLYGSPVTDWVSFTPTGAWSTNTTYTGKWRRVGDNVEVQTLITLAGAPTSAALTVNLPSGLSIDTTKLLNLSGAATGSIVGRGRYYDQPTQLYSFEVTYNSATSVAAIIPQSDGTYLTDSTSVTQAVPATMANTDNIQIFYTVPIVGWSSSQIMSSDANTSIVAARYSTNVAQSVANTGDTLIDFEDREFDTCGCVTTGASWKFTAPSPGYYRVTASTVYAASTYAAGNQYYGTVFKNGSVHSYFGLDSTESATSQSVSANGSVLLSLVAGDYIDVRMFNNRTAGATLLNGTTGANYITVEKISGPSQVMASDSVSALYTGAPPTGTLTNAYNITTFGTKVKDSHNAYSSGSYPVPVSGVYSIQAQTRQNATYALNKLAVVAIFIDGVEKYSGYFTAGGAQSYLWPTVSAHSVPLLAGQVVTIRSYNDATTPTFGSSATENFFSIVRTGNY